MPKITKIFELDITPQKFINNCSADELAELQILLSSNKQIAANQEKDLLIKNLYACIEEQKQTIEMLNKLVPNKKQKKLCR